MPEKITGATLRLALLPEVERLIPHSRFSH
jgi:hypothetical protein